LAAEEGWVMPTLLITTDMMRPGEGGGVRLLEQAGIEMRFAPRRPRSTEELLQQVHGCVASICGDEPYTEDVFASVPTLRHVARHGVGYNSVDVDAATKRDIVVTVTPGANTEAVADHTFGLMLVLAHRIIRDDQAIRRGEWLGLVRADIYRKTLGVIGLGGIGKAVVRRAKGFDMRVLAYEPAPDAAFVATHDVELVELDDVFRESHIVSLHAPLLAATTGLVDVRRLALMKPTAYLINTARGGLVDEDALYQALSSGQIAGAGLDVRVVEPSTGGRFAELDNVVLTPHAAGRTEGMWLAGGTMAAEAVLAVLRGERPVGLVNPAAWERRITAGQ
jgi:phosphoglycerate dehydrogenase-like enzyme